MMLRYRNTNQIVDQLLHDFSQSSATRGTNFENLVVQYLRDSKHFRSLGAVDRWTDWAANKGISQAPTGIDVVVEGNNGRRIAIQCKRHSNNKPITFGHIQGFLKTVPNGIHGVHFHEYAIISTTDQFDLKASLMLYLARRYVRRVHFGLLLKDPTANWQKIRIWSILEPIIRRLIP